MLTTLKLALIAPIAAIALVFGDILAPGNMIVVK